MRTEITHYPVNWVSGMKITQKHFTETDDMVIDGLRDCRMLSLGSFFYGLLPAESSNGQKYHADVNVLGDSVTVNVNFCRAVTANGERIEIINQPLIKHTNSAELISKLNLDSQSYSIYVIIQVNSFKREGYGEIQKDEIPTRQPYAKPSLSIDFVVSDNFKLSQTTFNNSLVIGKIKITNRIVIKENYYPPCMAISSNKELCERYMMMRNKTKEILHISLEIIKDIRTYDVFTSKLLARGLKYLAENTIQYLISNGTKLDLMGAEIPPINALSFFSELLNIHFYTVSSLSVEEQNEFQVARSNMPNNHRYSPDNYLKITSVPYNHDDIYDHFEKASDVISTLTEVYKNYLSKLKDLHIYWNRGEEMNKNPYSAPEPPIQNTWKF